MKIIKSTIKTCVYIAIVSGVYFGVNALLGEPYFQGEYAIVLSTSAILLHFLDKED